jgi:hypothetical protein
MGLYDLLLWLLAWLSADPVAASLEHPRAAAAVSAARASMAVDGAPSPTPAPKPTPGKCTDCNGTGWITHGDGHRTRCPCGAAGCPDGKCVPGASPATVSPAAPKGGR